MKIVMQYESILGYRFPTPAEARADEDRLPQIIATYQKDLDNARAKLNAVSGQTPTPETMKIYEDCAITCRALDVYKAKWAEVQAQRAAEGA